MTLEDYRQVLVKEIDKIDAYLPYTDDTTWFRTGITHALLLLDDCIVNGNIGVKDIFSYKGETT